MFFESCLHWNQVAQLQQEKAHMQSMQSQLQEQLFPESSSSPETIINDDAFGDTSYEPMKAESVTTRKDDHMKEMSWATKKRKPVPLKQPNPKPAKMPRTESNVGPIQLINGKVNKTVYIGSRRSGIN